MGDVLDAQVAAVVSLSWAGRVWRLSTRELTGEDVHALPGLLEAPDIDEEISVQPGGDVGVSVPIAVVLPAVSVASYLAAGHDLATATAEIALVWHRGDVLLHSWAARQIVADGDLTDPQHGDPTLPAGWLGATVEDSPYRVAQPIVRRTWEVSASTWPSAPEHGARYPLVLGAPDPEAAGEGPPAPVVEAAAGSNSLAVVSVGWCAASAVTLIDSAGTTAALDVSYQVDGLGQTVAVVTLTGSGLDLSAGATYTTAWAAGPALAPMGGSGPVHLAAYLLALGGADLDLPEWARVAELVGLEAGGYVDDPDSEAWEVARDLLSALPVSTRRARDGWAPVLLDPAVAGGQAVGTWREGGPWRRSSAWAGTGDSRITRIEVASDAGVLTAGPGTPRDAGLPHVWARALPRQQDGSADPAWNWSATLDFRALAWLARIGALGWEASAWQAPAQWGTARPGEWLRLVEDDGTDRHALVIRRSLSGGVWDYTLIRPAGR